MGTFGAPNRTICLKCGRQFVLNSTQKIIDEKTKNLIKDVLLERISVEGVGRPFEVSMPWLLTFIDHLIKELPKNLNGEVVAEDSELEVAVLEDDKLWSYVVSKNPRIILATSLCTMKQSWRAA